MSKPTLHGIQFNTCLDAYFGGCLALPAVLRNPVNILLTVLIHNVVFSRHILGTVCAMYFYCHVTILPYNINMELAQQQISSRNIHHTCIILRRTILWKSLHVRRPRLYRDQFYCKNIGRESRWVISL